LVSRTLDESTKLANGETLMKVANHLKYGIGFFSEQNVEIHLIQSSSLNVTAALHCTIF